MTMMLEMYDAVQARMIEEKQDSNPDEEWSSVLRRLEKPSENDRRKNRTEDERFAFILINLLNYRIFQGYAFNISEYRITKILT